MMVTVKKDNETKDPSDGDDNTNNTTDTKIHNTTNIYQHNDNGISIATTTISLDWEQLRQRLT